VDVIRAAYQNPPSEGFYYVKDLQYQVHLRVLRKQVQIGVRYNRGKNWAKVAIVPQDVGIGDLEDFRVAARSARREHEDEEAEPTLLDGRLMSVARLREEHRAWYVSGRREGKSKRTLDWYDDLWGGRLGPAIGELKLRELTPQIAERLKVQIRDAVRVDRPHADGRHTANHALAYALTLFEFARRRGYVIRNPFAEVEPWEVAAAEVYLEDADLAALGQALRNLELQARGGSGLSRHLPSFTALCALRVTLYTGCRHREELCWGLLSWLRDPRGPVPRLEIPRAKGDRGNRQGRHLYLGPDAVSRLLAIDRPRGSEHLLVPGRERGKSLFRLNEAWARVLRDAAVILEGSRERSTILAHLQPDGSVSGVPVKSTRHTARTTMVRAGIKPEHAAQLLGHRGAAITDTVYLHQHGPSLAEAAAKLETFTRKLMGEGREAGVLEFRREERG
jgi:integrase